MRTAQRAPLVSEEKLVERITFRGHPMVSSLHPTTIEVTTEEHLTEKGDCIIGVGASKGCAQLDERLKVALRNDRATVLFSIVVGSEKFEFQGSGNAGLTLSHPRDMVLRKSSFLSDRTLAVGTNAAAKDIPRKIVASLRNPHATGVLKIEVQ